MCNIVLGILPISYAFDLRRLYVFCLNKVLTNYYFCPEYFYNVFGCYVLINVQNISLYTC